MIRKKKNTTVSKRKFNSHNSKMQMCSAITHFYYTNKNNTKHFSNHVKSLIVRVSEILLKNKTFQ